MSRLGNRGGYTLIEVLAVLGIMGFVGIGAMALMVGAASCFDNASTEAFTDTDAVIAMQMVVSDVREAKKINILANGERLRVIPPKRTDEGYRYPDQHIYYDRHEPDMQEQTDFYVSDSTGVPGHDGDWLWRGKSNGTRRPLKKDVTAVHFEQGETSRSVKITIVARNSAASGPKETKLTQRVVYLRNW